VSHAQRRDTDTKRPATVLSEMETDAVRTNVMWVTAQVLLHADPNLDPHEYAVACGVPRRITHTTHGDPSGTITSGIRKDDGRVHRPGAWSAAWPR